MRARTLGIVAAAGLAALVGGCKDKTESHFVRVDNSNGSYSIIEDGNKRIFTIEGYGGILTDRRIGIWFMDTNHDEQVDSMGIIENSNYLIKERSEGPEYLFLEADRHFAQAKEEMGIYHSAHPFFLLFSRH